MKLKAFAVIDTNVIISFLLSKSSFPALVCDLIGSGNIIPLFGERMLDEYYTILSLKIRLQSATHMMRCIRLSTMSSNCPPGLTAALIWRNIWRFCKSRSYVL